MELLIVITLIGILSALAIPAIGSLGKASSLGSAGLQLTGLIEQARQNSMSKNVLTALVVLTDQGTEGDYRSAMLMEYNAADLNPAWKPVTRWMSLPEGIAADPTSTFFGNSVTLPTSAGGASPTVQYAGAPVSRFASRVFLPNGGVSNPAAAAQIQLVQDGGNAAANYYAISIIGTTGRTKVERP